MEKTTPVVINSGSTYIFSTFSRFFELIFCYYVEISKQNFAQACPPPEAPRAVFNKSKENSASVFSLHVQENQKVVRGRANVGYEPSAPNLRI